MVEDDVVLDAPLLLLHLELLGAAVGGGSGGAVAVGGAVGVRHVDGVGVGDGGRGNVVRCVRSGFGGKGDCCVFGWLVALEGSGRAPKRRRKRMEYGGKLPAERTKAD